MIFHMTSSTIFLDRHMQTHTETRKLNDRVRQLWTQLMWGKLFLPVQILNIWLNKTSSEEMLLSLLPLDPLSVSVSLYINSLPPALALFKTHHTTLLTFTFISDISAHTHTDTLLLFTINVCMQRGESICLSRVHIDFTQHPANAREQNQSSVL